MYDQWWVHFSNRKDRANVQLHFLDLFRHDGTTYALTAGRIGRQRDERRRDPENRLAGIHWLTPPQGFRTVNEHSTTDPVRWASVAQSTIPRP